MCACTSRLGHLDIEALVVSAGDVQSRDLRDRAFLEAPPGDGGRVEARALGGVAQLVEIEDPLVLPEPEDLVDHPGGTVGNARLRERTQALEALAVLGEEAV